jgi:dephospho-CoA kinase
MRFLVGMIIPNINEVENLKVIGVVGLNGSGKDEVLKFLKQKYNVPFISVGDLVREIASKEGLTLTRENLDKITRRYFDKFGQGYFLKQVIERIRQNQWQICGISGVRSPQDVSIIREAFNTDFVLIEVYIGDPKVRFSRIISRGSQRDQLTYEQFLRQDEDSQLLFKIEDTLELADIAISNDGTLTDLHDRIEQVISDNQLFENAEH